MFPFIETLRIEAGSVRNLSFHNERMNRTRRHFYPECKPVDLNDYILRTSFPDELTRCRITYGEEVGSVEYFPYRIRPVNSLKPINCQQIDYSYKYADRSGLDQLFALRGECDDVLIIRDGLITDTSIANVAFIDRQGRCYTPASPLLQGTMRASLLQQKILLTADIRLSDLGRFHTVCLFNAMIPFGKIRLPIHSISAASIQNG